MATLKPPSSDQICPSIGYGSSSIGMTSQEENADADIPKPSETSRWNRIKHSFDENLNPQLSQTLKQDLKTYHAQLIALGSAIGTGLFIASGAGLATAGPIPLLGAFAFVGMTLCPTIFALGEMATLVPCAGGFFEHCRLYTGEAWGGAMGWNYVLQWLITLPFELVASTIALQYWGHPAKHPAVWVTIFLFCIIVINILGVKRYGDVESVLSVMKFVAIVGFIIFGILCDLGLGFQGQAIGTFHWYQPGAADNGFYGLCSVMIIAAFAYSGSEVVGLTAAEQENVKRDMPRAIKKVFWRIGIFYIGSIFLIGLLVPYNDPRLLGSNQQLNTASSPFVLALKNSGASGLPSVFNAVILITVLSVANSSVYGSSRVLIAMAKAGLAPKAFAYVDKKGRPLRCFYLSFAFGLLAYLAELQQNYTVFLWFLSVCGLASIISWASICATHIRFHHALRIHKKPWDELPYQSPLGIIGSWIGLLCNLFIILLQFITAGWPVGYQDMTPSQRAQYFFQNFTAFILIVIFYVGFKFFKGTTIEGVAWSWRGPSFNNPSIKRGGTMPVNLRTDVDFEGSWELGDWFNYARDHPERVIREEPLWWCPGPLKALITFFEFPWRWRTSAPDVVPGILANDTNLPV